MMAAPILLPNCTNDILSSMSESTETSIHAQLPETTYYPGILYHGSKTPFNFKSAYDYENDAVDTDGSWTLGPGVYLVDNEQAAKEYSRVRQGSDSKNQYIYTSYAPDCKFLDFRGKNGGNVPVPKSIIHQWSEYFSEHVRQEIQAKPDVGPEREYIGDANNRQRIKVNSEYKIREAKKHYVRFLKEREERGHADLREMLGTASMGRGPAWAQQFREFIIKKMGYDGIIYTEGSEHADGNDNATYIIYNLDVLHFSQNPKESRE